MKNILIIAFLLFGGQLQAQYQDTGTIKGIVTDKEFGDAPLPFANVIIKGSNTGTTTNHDGAYSVENLEPGSYTIVFSFIGYETRELPEVKVEAGEVTEINTRLGANTASLDEVIITTVSRKDSEVALLLEQKGAVEIKGSIGGVQLARLGISNAAAATSRISGVNSSEASGNIYVRGLGDRYLFTTMNGLPVPSDNVDRKNIDLGLFPTGLIQDISIRKTFAVETSADQASGSIDITSRSLRGSQELKIGVGAGANSNALKVNDFRTTANSKDISFGFYSKERSTRRALVEQSWNTSTAEWPMDYSFSLTAGKRFGEKLEVLLMASQDVSFEHREGIFREYRSNFINDSITDVQESSREVNTMSLLNLEYAMNEKNQLRVNGLFINKVTDEVFEGGRNREASIFEETEPTEDLSQFIRDQNTRQTRLWVNQLSGEHQLTGRNELTWAAGYNIVNATQPNRIRNEVNFREDLVQLGRTGGFQQRKSDQEIQDRELNGLIKDKLVFSSSPNKQVHLKIGGDFRIKTRDFSSQFFGVEEYSTNTLNPSSIDHLSEIFTEENFRNNKLITRELQPDRYEAFQRSAGGFVNFNAGGEKLNVNVGLRLQHDALEVDYNVGNIPGRTGQAEKVYSNLYPSIDLKYSLDQQNNLRLAGSRTISLPEFKEVAPFEYVSQTGQVTRGNTELEASTNYNLDLKWEFFPTAAQLVSLSGFYKKIEDPINKVQDRGSAGVYSYFNSGKRAKVYGVEAEGRLSLVSAENGAPYDLQLTLNATRLWHEQDLKEVRGEDGNFLRTFRYKGLTETGLQGASEYIFNGSANVTTVGVDLFQAAVSVTYTSNNIYALGAAEIQTQSEAHYNDAIVEEGFVRLNAVVSQELGKWKISLKGKNLLDPTMKRTQLVRPSTTGIERKETVRSYRRGSSVSLGLGYEF